MRYQNHVCDLSAWVSPSALMALFAGLCISLALRLATFASWFFLFPLGMWAVLAVGLLPVLADLIGVTVSRILEMRAGWVPFLLRGVWCPHIQRHRLYAFLKELSGPSFFSRHHRLSYPHSDDLFLRSLIKGSLAFTRPLFT